MRCVCVCLGEATRSGVTYRKRFIFRFSCLRSLKDMCCESEWLDWVEAVMSTERRLSECWDRGLSIMEPVEACECGELTIPCPSWDAEADHSSVSETAGGVV